MERVIQNNCNDLAMMLNFLKCKFVFVFGLFNDRSSPRSDNFKNMRNSSSDVIRMQTYSNPQTQSSVSVESHPSLDKYSLPLSPARGPSDEDF